MKTFDPVVLLDGHADPYLVFGRGRLLYHAIHAHDHTIHLVTLKTIADLRPALHKGKPYPPRKAASFWLNHSMRQISSSRLRKILKGMVARKKGGDDGGANNV